MIGKRLMALGLAGITALSLAACGGTSSGGGSGGTAAPSGNGSDTNAAQTESGNIKETGKSEGNAAANTEKSDKTLVVSMAAEPANLWAIGTGQADNQGQMVQNCIGDSLVNYDFENQEVLPCLATEWEWVDDKRIQFTLRDDVIMNDGTPLEAADVLYTVKMATEHSANNDSGRYFDYAACEAVDEHTVIVGMNVVAPDFLSMLGESAFGIVTEDGVEAAGGVEAAAKNPIMGVGPYIFKEWKSGQYILLERNEDYWDKDYVGYYKEIKFNFTNDAATREMAVESGDAGIALELPVNLAATFMENDAIKTNIYDYDQVMHLFFNCRDGVCADKKVREAIRSALDIQAICQVATMGYGEISNGWFMPDGAYYVDVFEGEDRVQDLEKAKQLLAEAGYSDGLTLKTITQQQFVPTWTVIQEQLRLAGITLEIGNLDTAQFVTEAKAGNYDIILTGSAIETRRPSIFTFYQKANCEDVIGGSKITTDEIDAKIFQMIETPDTEEAKTLGGEIIRTIKDECWAVDLYTENKAVVMRPNMEGFRRMERGYVDFTTLYEVQ